MALDLRGVEDQDLVHMRGELRKAVENLGQSEPVPGDRTGVGIVREEVGPLAIAAAVEGENEKEGLPPGIDSAPRPRRCRWCR